MPMFPATSLQVTAWEMFHLDCPPQLTAWVRVVPYVLGFICMATIAMTEMLLTVRH